MAENLNQFQFLAYDKNGVRESGFIEAIDEADAVRQLANIGKMPFKIKAAGGRASSQDKAILWRSFFAPKLDLTRFFGDLSIMLNSGFNIDIALRAVADAETNRTQKATINSIHTQISEGKSVADAFSSHSEIPADVVALVASGEHSGRMDTVFSELAKNYAMRAVRRSEISEALLYPCFLILVLLGTLLMLSVYLVPAIEPIFENGGVERPLVVAMLSGFGAFVGRYGMLLFAGTAIALLLLIPLLRTKRARTKIVNLIVRMPVLGALIKAVTRGRYLHVMSLLLTNGVPLQESMKLASNVTPVEKYHDSLLEARQTVSSGGQFWKALSQSDIFTDSIISLVKLGEESNNLAIIMGRAAAITDSQLQRKISRFLTFLTPAITIFLGLMVGTLVISVMTTLLSINEIAIR